MPLVGDPRGIVASDRKTTSSLGDTCWLCLSPRANSAELRCSGIESGEPGYELLPLPEIPPTAGGRVAGARSREDIPWSGTFGLSFRLLRRYSRRLVSNWSSMLTNSPIEAVVTTTPFSLWSAAMVCAARTQGIHAIYVTQGLVSNVFASPSCDSAIVWSPYGLSTAQTGRLRRPSHSCCGEPNSAITTSAPETPPRWAQTPRTG